MIGRNELVELWDELSWEERMQCTHELSGKEWIEFIDGAHAMFAK